jgi:hypothetical protein
MASLADLFNPTFLMFLGILVLVVALLVVYFESKMREQNHKITSMLSLVSTLAEDMTGMKMGLNHLAIRTSQGLKETDLPVRENLGIFESNKLIEVSDDEEDLESKEESEQSDNETSDDEKSDDEYEDEDEDENENEQEVKVIKLQVSNEDAEDNNSYEEANNLEFDTEDLEGDFELNDELPEIGDDYVEQVLDLKYEAKLEENGALEESIIPSASDFKTITINLGDESHDTIDYKKLQLPKLRSIAIEKNLTTNIEASKLKKPELLKLLGAE